MNKLIIASIASLVCLAALVQASGYGQQMYGGSSGYGSSGYGMSGYGQQPSYGQNYDRKTGFKTVIYHPYGGVSNRFDYRTYPAYGNSYGHPAPYIKSGYSMSFGSGDQYHSQGEQY